MRSSSNQNRRTLRQNNRPLTPNQRRRFPVRFTPKTKYKNSRRDDNGVLFLSTRKRVLPTAEELETRKRKKREIKAKHIAKSSLQHKVIVFYEYGCNVDDVWRFGPGCSRKIIEFLQTHYEHLRNYSAAKSFFYTTLRKHREAAVTNTPHLDPFRERRGENKRKGKHEHPRIVELCDEWFSEPNSTAPKIQSTLQQNGFTVSTSTIHRIAKDLCFRWTKPWYTDILTPAQKLKRKLFCSQLLRLGPPQLLQVVVNWLFTDEKWWDIVGPSMSRYVKADSKKEAKMHNQVLCNATVVDSHY